MSKNIEVTCGICGLKFSRAIGEHKRSVRLERPEFCSRSCTGKHNAKSLDGHRVTAHLKNHTDNRRDEFTGFKYYVRKAVEREKGCLLTLAEVKEQWEKQAGKCAYTSIPLILVNEKEPIRKANKLKYKKYQMASLDRIDSSKGYAKGNIQFVSLSINFMKNSMSDEDTKEFLQLIKTS